MEGIQVGLIRERMRSWSDKWSIQVQFQAPIFRLHFWQLSAFNAIDEFHHVLGATAKNRPVRPHIEVLFA